MVDATCIKLGDFLNHLLLLRSDFMQSIDPMCLPAISATQFVGLTEKSAVAHSGPGNGPLFPVIKCVTAAAAKTRQSFSIRPPPPPTDAAAAACVVVVDRAKLFPCVQ